MTLVMRVVGLASGGTSPIDGQYLYEYDPDRRGINPVTGEETSAHLVCTAEPTKALRFKSFAEFHAVWARQSTRWPMRSDGRPNRPLTAFSVETVRVDG